MPLFSDWETLTPTVSGHFFKDVLGGEALASAGITAPAADAGAPDGAGPSPLVEVSGFGANPTW